MIDSTGISDCLLTQDTVSLYARASAAACAGLQNLTAAAREAALARGDYDEAGKPQICWASSPERAALVNGLFADAQKVAEACSANGPASAVVPLADEQARQLAEWVAAMIGGAGI